MVTFDVFGAAGGGGGGGAGLGGEVKATLAVAAGETFQMMVGGQGAFPIDPVPPGVAAAGGFNGGGAGGAGGFMQEGAVSKSGGGGGGASDVRTGSCAATLACGLADRIIVAGGGGGVSPGLLLAGYGGGGAPSGTVGAPGTQFSGATGGGGGTQSSGGAFSDGGSGGGAPGGPGSSGTGGGGGPGPSADSPLASFGGGGGGGGYYGGGGGGGGSPGEQGGGGGGGSSLVPSGPGISDTSFTNAVQSGDGVISVSYTTPDTTPPTIMINSPADGAVYLLNQTVSADYSCTDETGGSGLASCVGSVANGSAIDTTTVGAHAFTVNAADNVGNASSLTVHYTVGYTFSGWLAPVNSPPTVNTGKAGRTYPLKWQLQDANGNLISSLGAISSVTYKSTSCNSFTGDPTDGLETSTTGGTSLRYDATTNDYVYNWATPGPGCYTLFLILASGQVYPALFNLS
jgi:hypothetical protein